MSTNLCKMSIKLAEVSEVMTGRNPSTHSTIHHCTLFTILFNASCKNLILHIICSLSDSPLKKASFIWPICIRVGVLEVDDVLDSGKGCMHKGNETLRAICEKDIASA